MSAAILDNVFVMLCDWRGRCVWTSTPHVLVDVGEFIWRRLTADSQERAKAVFARVVTLREMQEADISDEGGRVFHGRFWPLDSPDAAVCIIGARIPEQMARLGPREIECLKLLSEGADARSMAEQLDVGVSTVHTHLKRARVKLGLPSMEALIAFSARYFYQPESSLKRRAAN